MYVPTEADMLMLKPLLTEQKDIMRAIVKKTVGGSKFIEENFNCDDLLQTVSDAGPQSLVIFCYLLKLNSKLGAVCGRATFPLLVVFLLVVLYCAVTWSWRFVWWLLSFPWWLIWGKNENESIDL